MDSDFMNAMADGLCRERFEVVRFEFPYMQERRRTGKKRPPNRAPVLLAHFAEMVDRFGGPEKCIVAGKSMGGRMASMLAAERPVRGVICLGYPFHAPGKPDRVRIEHFSQVAAPVLILQGERDPFGKKEEVSRYVLPDNVNLSWLPDGDHDLKPRKKSGYTHEENLQQALQAMTEFILADT